MIIYKVTNKVNGKIYIGLTTFTIFKRMRGHYNSSKTPKFHFHLALKKYNEEDFVWEVIDRCESGQYDDLKEMEVAWINYYDSYNNGYNSTLGGEGILGCQNTRTEESNLKIAKLTKKEVFSIIKMYNNTDLPLAVIGDNFSVSAGAVFDIVKKKTWVKITKDIKIRQRQQPKIVGTRHGMSKVTEKDVLKIRKLSKEEMYSQKDLSRMFGLSRPNIVSIIKRETWKHI